MKWSGGVSVRISGKASRAHSACHLGRSWNPRSMQAEFAQGKTNKNDSNAFFLELPPNRIFRGLSKFVRWEGIVDVVLGFARQFYKTETKLGVT